MIKPGKLLVISIYSLLSSTPVAPYAVANPLRAPDVADNKILFYCSNQMTNIFHIVIDNRDNMPEMVFSRVSRLLMSAEIDSQFKKYPSCFNKLERARLFLKQTGIKVELIPPPDKKM